MKNRHNMTTGANKDDHHLRGVNIARDIPIDQWFELRMVESGEGCPKCGTGVLEVFINEQWVRFDEYRQRQIAEAYDKSIQFLRDRLGEDFAAEDESQKPKAETDHNT